MDKNVGLCLSMMQTESCTVLRAKNKYKHTLKNFCFRKMSTFLRKMLLSLKFSDSVSSYDPMIEAKDCQEIYFDIDSPELQNHDIDSPELQNQKRFRLFPNFLKITTSF